MRTDEQVQELDRYVKTSGRTSEAYVHACGGRRDQPESRWMSMCRLSLGSDGAVVTQFTMTTLEELGLLKMDFLGLRNLTVIQ